MKRFVVGSLCTLLMLITVPIVIAEESDEEILKWAMSLIQRATVIDTHADTISVMLDDDYDISLRHDEHHVDIPRLFEGGVNGQFFAVWLSPTGHKGWEVQRALEMIDALKEAAAKDERLVIAYDAKGILEAQRNGKIAGVLCVEGGHAIVDSIPVLRRYFELGVRYMTLTWMNNNNWADASGPDQSNYGDIPSHGGLTDFGREVVREMNRIGMIVDVSHVHDDTFWDVMEITTKPVIASHSDTWALNPHYRNIKDDMLRAIAKNGGVVGVNFAASFVSEEYDKKSSEVFDEAREKINELEAKYKDDPDKLAEERRALFREYRDKVQRPPLSELVDHIEHIAEVAGYDHVGLGGDLDGISTTPQQIDDTTDLVYIVVELRERGWNEENIRKFLGENFLRVLKANVGS